MNKSTIIGLFLLIFSQSMLFAQETDWIDDSLSFYKAKVEAAVAEKDFEVVIDLHTLIVNQGSKTLNQKVFDYFYEQKDLQDYQKQPKVLGIVYQNIGTLEFYKSNFDLSKTAFGMALEIFKKAGMKKDAAGMAMNLAVLLEKASKYDSAIINYRKALPIFEELKDTTAVSYCLENISLSFSQKGVYDTALIYLFKVDSILRINTPENDGRWVSLYYNKGHTYQTMSIYDKALKNIIKGLRISQEVENGRLINNGYSYLVDIYASMKDTVNLKKYVRAGRDFAAKIEDNATMAHLDFDLGYLYMDQLNYDSARYFADRGLKIAEKVGSDTEIWNGYILLANIDYQMGDFPSTIKNLQKIMRDVPSKRKKSISGMYHNLGSAYMQLGNFNKSNPNLNKSLELAVEINDWNRLVETYETLSINYKKQGNYKDALRYYELYKQYEDSIFNETTSKQIAEVQTQYETEKKDQSIAALEQDKEIQTLKASRQQSQIYLSLVGLALVLIIAFIFYYRSRVKQKANKALAVKNAEIEEQNKEKEMLLKEIHHRVKNNLQIISSLLSMQTRTLSDSKTIDAMKESQSRVKTMALIHEKLYQYDNLARINMNEYMKQLSDFLSQTYHSDKAINVVIESEDISLDIDTAVPLGLITNELLSNALKYAFEDMEKGQITIQLLKDLSGNYTLTISDSGKGLAADMDIEKSKSLGLKLVRTLTRQINGNLSISSNPGATFSIVFSDNKLAA